VVHDLWFMAYGSLVGSYRFADAEELIEREALDQAQPVALAHARTPRLPTEREFQLPFPGSHISTFLQCLPTHYQTTQLIPQRTQRLNVHFGVRHSWSPLRTLGPHVCQQRESFSLTTHWSESALLSRRFDGPALRHVRLNSLFQEALYLSSGPTSGAQA